MPPSSLPVLQTLHEDWQTVGTLVSEISAFRTDTLDGEDVENLVVRLCARLYALSRVETELLYPCLEQCPALASGQQMHEEVVTRVQALLDAVVDQENIGASLQVLTEQVRGLQQFEYREVYPHCADPGVDLMGEQMVKRRHQLLESFNTE